MPSPIDNLRVTREHDRRVKLTEDDKERIRSMYKDGMGIRAIAREYEGKCTRRAIQYTLFPERYAALLANARRRRKIKGNTLQEYGKEKWRDTMREHRAYKKKLYINQ